MNNSTIKNGYVPFRNALSFDKILCAYFFELAMAMLSFTYFQRYVSREREMCKEVAESNLVLAEKVRQDRVPDKTFHVSRVTVL